MFTDIKLLLLFISMHSMSFFSFRTINGSCFNMYLKSNANKGRSLVSSQHTNMCSDIYPTSALLQVRNIYVVCIDDFIHCCI